MCQFSRGVRAVSLGSHKVSQEVTVRWCSEVVHEPYLILEVSLASTDATEIDTTPWNPLEPESEWKKHIVEWPSIFGQFFPYVIMQQIHFLFTSKVYLTVQESIVHVTTSSSRYKSKIENLIQTALPILDTVWLLIHLLTLFLYLVSPSVHRTSVRATELGVHHLWGIRTCLDVDIGPIWTLFPCFFPNLLYRILTYSLSQGNQ